MRDEFLRELKALMEKYDVSIGFSVGDTQGLYDEKVVIDHRISRESWKEETWLEVDGWWLGSEDIGV
jgi:radical SAM superfamily enzyme YgiQ (UPF0313 family)